MSYDVIVIGTARLAVLQRLNVPGRGFQHSA